jgi:6-pyruvoyltetrahydropterin/6-carboxytetrahydropterin synthase
MVIDFNEIKKRINPIINKLDHSVINDILVGTTTSEYIASWIFKQANDQLGNVSKVTVFETDTCGAIVER